MSVEILIEAAPIAGYTNHAFRRLLVKMGANVVYTEMVSATALFYENKKTLELLWHDRVNDKGEKIKNVVQLFGKVPEHFEFAIKSGHLEGFDEININMGCPAPKIVKNGEGSALMKTPDLARAIIESCVMASKESIKKPVTVKFRLGYTEPNFVADEFAKMCESAGASKIIVHGRYASQGYSGVADWYAIKKVKDSVRIPVLANGDITSSDKLKECIKVTGADGVMIARALFGAPWKITLEDRKPDVREIKEVIRLHMDLQEQLHGEDSFRELKKQLLAYCDHFDRAKELKLKIAVSKTFDEAREVLGL